MIYNKINLNKLDKRIIKEAVDILNNGGVIIYPTDTAYALGCDAGNENAAAKVLKIKKRKNAKSLPVIVSDIKMAKKFFFLNNKEAKLAKKFWPIYGFKLISPNKGKISLVLPSSISMAKNVMANDNTIAVRVPLSKWAQELAFRLGRPIVSTSANLSGANACYTIQDIEKSLDNRLKQVDLLLDAGELCKVLPSTIVRVKEEEIEILREGSAKVKI